MAKVILFDLGDTLEHQDAPGHHVLRDDAKDVLDHIKSLNDANGQSPILGLVSDYLLPDEWGFLQLQNKLKDLNKPILMKLNG